MTRRQRAIIGLCASLALGAAIWALIALAASAQRQYESVRVQVAFQSSFENVEGMCGMMMGEDGRGVIACSNPAVIVAPHPCLFPSDRYARIMCHELTCHVQGNDTHHLTRACRERV